MITDLFQGAQHLPMDTELEPPHFSPQPNALWITVGGARAQGTRPSASL